MSTEVDDEQRVLSEASHDLANRIHRSYYFLELLSDAVGPDAETATSLLSRLRETIEDVEKIVRTTLAFVRPIELRLLQVRLEDLVASMRTHVGMRSVVLGGDSEAGRSPVRVDPARNSEALGLLCQAAMAGADGDAPLNVELDGGDPVGLRILRKNGTQPAGDTDLGIALTARIARLHGGALDVEGGEAPSLTLRLPGANQEA